VPYASEYQEEREHGQRGGLLAPGSARRFALTASPVPAFSPADSLAADSLICKEPTLSTLAFRLHFLSSLKLHLSGTRLKMRTGRKSGGRNSPWLAVVAIEP
jgi:hypothetical protein